MPDYTILYILMTWIMCFQCVAVPFYSVRYTVSLQHTLQSSIRTVGPKTARVLFTLDFPGHSTWTFNLDTFSFKTLTFHGIWLIFIGKSRGRPILGQVLPRVLRTWRSSWSQAWSSQSMEVRFRRIMAGRWPFSHRFPSVRGANVDLAACWNFTYYMRMNYDELLYEFSVTVLNLIYHPLRYFTYWAAYGKYTGVVQCGVIYKWWPSWFLFFVCHKQRGHLLYTLRVRVLGQWKVCCTSTSTPLSVFWCLGSAGNGFRHVFHLLTFQVVSNDYAFAMVNLATGLGACWGDSRFGGDCSVVDFNGVTKAGWCKWSM